MNLDFVLGKLSEIMGWDDDRATQEFLWLRLMSRMKYDAYQGFLAGARFVESLADWLQQFEPGEREAAYAFERDRLVFVSSAEMNHLVELFYPETVMPKLLSVVAERRNIPAYRVWSDNDARKDYEVLLRKSLFIELSDGARIDIFRRSNAGVISNEQVVTAPRITDAKWDEMLSHLQDELHDDNARFACIFLVDDFIASCTTLLRQKAGDGWEGRLPRFWGDIQCVHKSHFEDGWTLYVHHYLATFYATQEVHERHDQIVLAQAGSWFSNVEFSFGAELPPNLPAGKRPDDDFLTLVEKYYDPSIERHQHDSLSGSDDVRMGYGECALPVVLEHNAPNNSLAILWAESDGSGDSHAMRPLFRRRQRHT